MTPKYWLIAAAMLLGFWPGSASATWDRVLGYVQPDVEVVVNDDDRLVLKHPALDTALVLTTESGDGSHIFGQLRRRRGGNPYRVWVATELLWSNPDLPRSLWGTFFRAEFLRIVRAPTTNLAR